MENFMFGKLLCIIGFSCWQEMARFKIITDQEPSVTYHIMQSTFLRLLSTLFLCICYLQITLNAIGDFSAQIQKDKQWSDWSLILCKPNTGVRIIF